MENKDLTDERLSHSTPLERSGFDQAAQGVRGDDQAGQAGIDAAGYGASASPNYPVQREAEKPWKGDTETSVIGEPLKT